MQVQDISDYTFGDCSGDINLWVSIFPVGGTTIMVCFFTKFQVSTAFAKALLLLSGSSLALYC
jgi:hypothetical protein